MFYSLEEFESQCRQGTHSKTEPEEQEHKQKFRLAKEELLISIKRTFVATL